MFEILQLERAGNLLIPALNQIMKFSKKSFTPTPKPTPSVLLKGGALAHTKSRDSKFLNRRAFVRGFTLIELLVVIAIIGMLSSIVFASLNSARVKAKNVAALSTGTSLLTVMESCSIDGGKVTVPDCSAGSDSFCTTDPTNNICTLGASYGTWPRTPQGWNYYKYAWVGGEDNLMYMRSTYSGGWSVMHCGYYPEWAGYCGSGNVGLCRGSQTYTCTYVENGIWK